MQTLVTYRYSGSSLQLDAMREYASSIGLKPGLYSNYLELTLVGHFCGSLETLGWERYQLSIGEQKRTPSPVKRQPDGRGGSVAVRDTPRHASGRSQRRKSDKSVWELDKQLKEKARTDLKLDPTPLTKPIKVAASLVREIEEHNKRTPTKPKKSGVWQQGTTFNITLRSRRPSCIYLDCICSNCRGWANPVHKYKDSSHGIVYLCHRCNEVSRERSFGSRGGDAMYAAVGRRRAR